MTDFKQLRVGRLARELVIQAYQATANFPAQERYGLVSQMRRATISVGSNIAEGAGRNTDREFARFLRLAADQRTNLNSRHWPRRTSDSWAKRTQPNFETEPAS